MVIQDKMTKGTKIAIGVLTTLAVGGLVTWLVLSNRKPQEDEEWEDSDLEGGITKDGVGGTTKTPISKQQRQANNFDSVKKYFGGTASDYQNRLVVTRNERDLAKSFNQQDFGLGGVKIMVVYWKDGHFTVKIGDTKAAIQGYYYKGGTIIKVTKGKGNFASKAGLRVEDSNRLRAIGKALVR